MLTGMFIPIRAHSLPFGMGWVLDGCIYRREVSKSIFCCNRFNFGRFSELGEYVKYRFSRSFFKTDQTCREENPRFH